MGTEQSVFDYVRANAPAGDPEAILAAVDSFSGRWMMNLGPRKGLVLDEAVDRVGARRILELGAYFGYSAIRMAHRAGPEASVISIEASPDRHAVSSGMVDYAGLSDRVRFILGRAEDVIPTLDGLFDLVFIDHYGEHYRADLELIEARGLLRPGSAVVADNAVVHRPTVDPYLDHVRKSGLYDSTLHRVGGDGVEVSIWHGN
jgi:catechol O-methyltransferase